MTFLYLLEFALIALFVATVATQIFLPMLFNTPLFPIFRGSVHNLTKLSDANDEVDQAKFNTLVKRDRQLADAIRKGTIKP